MTEMCHLYRLYRNVLVHSVLLLIRALLLRMPVPNPMTSVM
jgi:hypothetical protein